MNYEFPIIRTIDDVLPHIEGRSEFIVADRDDHIIINYAVADRETFPPADTLTGMVRRECRGIIFDKATGAIIRRPYHKFFNINERDETQTHALDFTREHHVMEKLDGSMIVPYRVGDHVTGRLIWGTKMGNTDVAQPVYKFIESHPEYTDIANLMINSGISPIFEWCTLKQRIVLEYPEDRLVLTAARDMVDGSYMCYSDLRDLGIPDVVQVRDSVLDIGDWLNEVRDIQDAEGFVVRFADGHMVKAKGAWYLQLHKAIESIQNERNVVEMILDNTLDDVKASMIPDVRHKLENFESGVVEGIDRTIKTLYTSMTEWNKMTRKEFALGGVAVGLMKPLAFTVWDNAGVDECRNAVLAVVRKNLTNTKNYEAMKIEIIGDVNYDAAGRI
jgi:T4 RnlA family RNA ligase